MNRVIQRASLGLLALLLTTAVVRAAEPVTIVIKPGAAPRVEYGAGRLVNVLNVDDFRHYVDHFNSMEDENVARLIPNAQAWNWMKRNVPAFECPDKAFEEIYWYRWWTYRKHIIQFPSSFALSEFLTKPPVSSAVGHHVMEGRWLRDKQYLDGDILYWLRGTNGKPYDVHKYSSWTVWAAYERYLVNGDEAFIVDLLDDCIRDYRQWEAERLNAEGLFWQFDVRDAMEESISGSRRDKNARPSINSYMYGNARAIADIATLGGKPDLAAEFRDRAARLKALVQSRLWNPEQNCFEVRLENGAFSNAREEIGFIPWYFDLPDADARYEIAWAQLADPRGFSAPFGITTAERRHPKFRSHGCCKCEWDGAVWPFATAQTLTALANVLNNCSQPYVTRQDYFDALLTYARSQHRNGRPYIGEYLDETTGAWLKGDADRGRYYNHSTFCDLVITGLVGLRPRADGTVVLNPLLPAKTWDWFCLDAVAYHGHLLTIVWDRTGTKYGLGRGLTVRADGKTIAHADDLGRVTGTLEH